MPPKLWQEAVISWNDVAPTLISENTQKRYLVSLAQCSKPLESKALHQIDAACLRDLIKARREQGASNSTIRRDLTAICKRCSQATAVQGISSLTLFAG